MNLSDRDNLLADLCAKCNLENEGCPCEPTDCFIYQAVVDAPTVDAVPVVRCKDCAVPHNRWTGCPKMNGTIMPPDGFCSFGERKADHDG